MIPQQREPSFTTVTDDALGEYDAVGLIDALQSREVHPDEVTAAALARARQAQDALNAVVDWVPTPTVGSGPFGGVPSFIKDNEDLAGLACRQGSRAVPDTPVEANSEFVSQFVDLGFTVLGKSTLPEFGLTATTEPLLGGPTRNPWNIGHSTGGSSGGSAALVAAGVVPIAHANDGGGSIRIPASCCGVVGLKPSRGRVVGREDLEKLPVAITAQGVVTRSVRDTALFFSEIEKLHQDPALSPIGHITAPGSERLRIGLVLEGMSGLPVNSDVQAAVTATAAVLEGLGHHVEPIAFPFDEQFGRDFLRYWAGLAFAIQYGGKQVYGDGFDRSLLEPLTLGLGRFFRTVAVRTPTTLRRLRNFGEEYEQLFTSHDVLLSPVLSHAPPPIGYLSPDLDVQTHLVRLLRYASFTAVQNVSGAPAISLPLGMSDDGLPIGVQAAASFGQEARLLGLAYELEEAMPWR